MEVILLQHNIIIRILPYYSITTVKYQTGTIIIITIVVIESPRAEA